MLLDPNETANWIPYVIPLGPTTESHIIRYLFPERSLGRVPVDLAFATTMHLPFNESIFPENSGICALLFYKVIMLARSQLLEELIFKLFPSKETITLLSIGKNSVYLPE